MDDAVEGATPASRGDEYRGARAARNSLFYLSGQVFVLAIALVTTPIVLSRIGLIEFGIWTLATLTVGYITVLDPGFGDLVTRYGAQARTRGESHVAARICALGSLAWIGFGVILSPLVYFIVPFALHRFRHLDPAVASSAITFFYWTFALIIFGSLLSTLSGRLVARGEQWIVTVIDASTRTLYAVALVVLLIHHWRLSAIVVATTLQYVVAFLATLILVAVRDGKPYASPRGLDREMLRQLYRFGGLLQLNAVLDTLTFDTDPLVLSLFVSSGATGNWAIAQRLGRLTAFFATAVQSNVLPGISAAHAADEGLVAMRRIYVRANRMIFLLGAFVGGAFIAFGPLIMKAWLGRAHWGANIALVLVVLIMFAGLPRSVTGNAILAMGRVGLGVRAQWLAFVTNTILTVALVVPYGLNGVLFATVIAKVAATGYLLVRFSRIVESSLRELVLPWMVPIVVITAVTAGAGRALAHAWPAALGSKPAALAALCILGAGYSALYLVGLRLTHYFSRADLLWLKNSAPAKLGTLLRPGLFRLLSGHNP